MPKRIAFMALVWLLLMACCAHAQPQSFFERKAEGWFWYQTEPLPPEPEEPEEDPPPVVAITVESEIEDVPPPEPSASKGPAPLSAVWIKENLTKYLDIATDNPTQENVAAYMYLQRLAVDKAQRFADMTQVVIQNEPLLDENIRSPVATYGAAAATDEANKQLEEALQDLAKDVGVWVFFKSDCPNSAKLKSPLDYLERNYGYKIYPISMDGKALEGFYPEYVTDAGQSGHLQVVQTPAVFLANPQDNAISPVSQGLVSVPELRRRILIAATTSGWIDKNRFEKTRPTHGYVMDGENLEGLSEEDIEDPEELIKILRGQLLKQQR